MKDAFSVGKRGCGSNRADCLPGARGRKELFDATVRRPLGCQRPLRHVSMDASTNENPHPGELPAGAAGLPRLWIGYLLGVATLAAEMVAVELHPELAKGGSLNLPLYLFLALFVGWVYWLVCVYQIHQVMARIPGWRHPISPGRAVGFHFIPLYNLYWVFHWPAEIARFVNVRVRKPLMKPYVVGAAVFAAVLVRLVLEPGLGLILLFIAASYISECLKRALALPPAEARALPEDSGSRHEEK